MKEIIDEKWLKAVAGGMPYKPAWNTDLAPPFIETPPGELPNINVGHGLTQPHKSNSPANDVETSTKTTPASNFGNIRRPFLSD